jgi:hypothetical protein
VKHDEISALTLRPSYHLVVSGLKKAIEDQIDYDKEAAVAQPKDANSNDNGLGESGNGIEGAQNE